MRASERVLKEDHAQIRRAIAVLDGMALRVAGGGREPFSGGDAEQVLRFLQSFVDRHHTGKEESVLFPALLQDPSQSNFPLLRTVTSEHNRWRSLIIGFEEAVRLKRPKDFGFYSRRLIEALREHVGNEERELVALTENTLSETEEDQVAADMRKYDQQWRQSVVVLILKRLDEMEPRYVRSTRHG